MKPRVRVGRDERVQLVAARPPAPPRRGRSSCRRSCTAARTRRWRAMRRSSAATMPIRTTVRRSIPREDTAGLGRGGSSVFRRSPAWRGHPRTDVVLPVQVRREPRTAGHAVPPALPDRVRSHTGSRHFHRVNARRVGSGDSRRPVRCRGRSARQVTPPRRLHASRARLPPRGADRTLQRPLHGRRTASVVDRVAGPVAQDRACPAVSAAASSSPPSRPRFFRKWICVAAPLAGSSARPERVPGEGGRDQGAGEHGGGRPGEVAGGQQQPAGDAGRRR